MHTFWFGWKAITDSPGSSQPDVHTLSAAKSTIVRFFALALVCELMAGPAGKYKDVPQMAIDDQSAASIAGFEVCELFDRTGDQKHTYGLLKKVKLADKSKNLEMLGRYLKLFTADREDPSDANRITTIIVDL